MIALLALVLSGGANRILTAHSAGARARLRIAQGRGELTVRGLRPTPAGEAYEVWLKPAHSPPLPTEVLFTVSAGGRATLELPESLSGISEVLVTPEPAGGSLSPTHAPVITFHLS